MPTLRRSHFLLIFLAWSTSAPALRAEVESAPESGAVGPRAVRIRALVDQLPNPATPRRTIPATQVTLDVNERPLAEVLREIEKQTGNKTSDDRQAVDRQANHDADSTTGSRVTLHLTNEPYWAAMDALLDAANVTATSQSGGDALAISDRPPGTAPRVGSATYAGPFRLQVLEVQAQRSSREMRTKSLKLQLEIAWEPRLRPLAASLAAPDLEATIDGSAPLAASFPSAVFTTDVPLGTQAIEMTLPFELPPRQTSQITSLRGKLRVLVPGRQARFEFSDLVHAAGKSQRIDDTEVFVDDVRKNNEIWEIHMRLHLADRNPALDSQRGWAFDNRSFLLDGQGQPIENAGFETTSEAEHEIGVAYFFDVADDLAGLRWVYETPAAIAETQADFELHDIELP